MKNQRNLHNTLTAKRDCGKILTHHINWFILTTIGEILTFQLTLTSSAFQTHKNLIDLTI